MAGAVAPTILRELKKTSDAAQLNRLGSTGTNLYYCTNYMSPQHRDRDATWSICMQVEKNGLHQSDEFNFSYTQWGVYIVTEPKCLWYVRRFDLGVALLISHFIISRFRWFDSSHVHGTIMPRRSSLEAPHPNRAASRGPHKTATQKNTDKAMERKAVRVQNAARTEYWLEGDLDQD